MDQNAQILAQLASTPGLQQHLQQMFANNAGMGVINRDNRAQPQFSMGANTPELAALRHQHEMMQPNPNGWASHEQGYQFQPVDPALLQHMQKLYGQTPNGQMLQAQQLMSQMNPRPSQQLQ
jgi:hypothetical protein